MLRTQQACYRLRILMLEIPDEKKRERDEAQELLGRIEREVRDLARVAGVE